MAGRRESGGQEPIARGRTPLSVRSHRDLLGRQRAIVDALGADPDRGRLLLANAALAFADAGVELSPAMADHVLHTVRQSAAATTRREALTARLRKALGVVPHPSDPSWLAATLFGRLDVAPLATSGHDPVYHPAIPVETEARLRTHLPPASRPRLPARGTPRAPAGIPWRLDLDAEVPELPRARRTPKTLSLEQLWFYRGSHELVRPLLELGILEVSVLPTLTRTQYEAVRAGTPTGGFIDWVDAVTFPERAAPSARAARKTTTPAEKATGPKTAARKATATKATARKAAGAAKASGTKTAAPKPTSKKATAKQSSSRAPRGGSRS